MTIKLNLLFVMMDILALMAYPIVFLYGKMKPVSRVSIVSHPAPSTRTRAYDVDGSREAIDNAQE